MSSSTRGDKAGGIAKVNTLGGHLTSFDVLDVMMEIQPIECNPFGPGS